MQVEDGEGGLVIRRRVRGKQPPADAAAVTASRCFCAPHPLSLGVAGIVGSMQPGAPPDEEQLAERCDSALHSLSPDAAEIWSNPWICTAAGDRGERSKHISPADVESEQLQSREGVVPAYVESEHFELREGVSGTDRDAVPGAGGGGV